MRKMFFMVLVIVALSAMVGSASAQINGVIQPFGGARVGVMQ